MSKTVYGPWQLSQTGSGRRGRYITTDGWYCPSFHMNFCTHVCLKVCDASNGRTRIQPGGLTHYQQKGMPPSVSRTRLQHDLMDGKGLNHATTHRLGIVR